jgi:hypothetical protein
MFRRLSLLSISCTALLAAALVTCPGRMLAQRGAGGGHTGGGVAGGGGLSGGGRGTGIDTKDDLKDFHLALAVQATPEQIAAYKLMMKSTEAANAGVQAFLDQLGKQNQSFEIASAAGATIDQAIEKARTGNNQFLEELSPRQKSGLKEIIKKLARADAALAQQAKALDLEIPQAKRGGPPLTGSAESLDRALRTFQAEQVALGEEMSVGASADGENSFEIPPVKNSIKLGNQSIAIVTAGIITKVASETAPNAFRFELTADLSDLQQNIPDVLRQALDKSDPCGERLTMRTATLAPQTPASLAEVRLHFERWTCRGSQTNEMLEGDGAIGLKLTPLIGQDGRLRLVPEMIRVDAQGLVGDLLRSGSLGDMVTDKITESLLSPLRLGGDLKTLLPASAQGSATLQHAQFQGTGSGHLQLQLNGEIRLPNDQVAIFIGELKGHSGSRASSQKTAQGALPR